MQWFRRRDKNEDLELASKTSDEKSDASPSLASKKSGAAKENAAREARDDLQEAPPVLTEREKRQKHRKQLLREAIRLSKEKREAEERIEALRLRNREALSVPKEEPFEYVGDCRNSGEISLGISLVLNAALFTGLAIGGFYIGANDFDLNPCRTASLTSNGEYCVRPFALGSAPTETNTVNVTTCIGVDAADSFTGTSCDCNLLEDALPNENDREGCINQTVVTNGIAVSTITCIGIGAFQALCEDRTSCPDDLVQTLSVAGYLYATVLTVMVIPSVLAAAGYFYFRGLHPNDFFRAFTCGEKAMICGVKSHHVVLRVLLGFHLMTLAFAFSAYVFVEEQCSEAETTKGENWEMQEDARDLFSAGVILMLCYTVIQTSCNCFCTVRGELVHAIKDDSRDCVDCCTTQGCGKSCGECCVFWLCCSECRARPYSEVRIFKKCVLKTADRCGACGAYCWCRGLARNCLYWVCRCFCNAVFCFTCEPVGYLLENLWNYRHYIEP